MEILLLAREEGDEFIHIVARTHTLLELMQYQLLDERAQELCRFGVGEFGCEGPQALRYAELIQQDLTEDVSEEAITHDGLRYLLCVLGEFLTYSTVHLQQEYINKLIIIVVLLL